MLKGRPNLSKLDDDQLSTYIEGWLQYRENRKYERFWLVLKGNIVSNIVTAGYLLFFKDFSTHVEDNCVGSCEIKIPQDKVEFVKQAGCKKKSDFTILLNQTKFHFRADDEISRKKWIYALCDLLGKRKGPSELPSEDNCIHPSCVNDRRRRSEIRGIFSRSKTLPVSSSSARQSKFKKTTIRHSPPVRRLTETEDSPPVAAPRSRCSLPFLLSPGEQLPDLKWFYPGMGREAANTMLAECQVGSYLLRDSESKPGSYSLTFKDHDRIKNHMIIQSSDRQYRFHTSEIDMSFPSPQKAVEFYMIKRHGKDLTPFPCCRNDASDTEDGYLLPSEINLKQPPQDSSQSAHSYFQKELPPTPGDDIQETSSEEETEESYSYADSSSYLVVLGVSSGSDDNGEPCQMQLSSDALNPKKPSQNNDEVDIGRKVDSAKNSSSLHSHGASFSNTKKSSRITKEVDIDCEVNLTVNSGSSNSHNTSQNNSRAVDESDYLQFSGAVKCDEEDPEYFEYDPPELPQTFDDYLDGKLQDKDLPILPEKPAELRRRLFTKCSEISESDYENQPIIESDFPDKSLESIVPELPKLPDKPDTCNRRMPSKGARYFSYDECSASDYENQQMIESLSVTPPLLPPRDRSRLPGTRSLTID